MKKSNWLWSGAVLLTLGALGTASCGASDTRKANRGAGGAGGEGGAPTPAKAGSGGSGGSGTPLAMAGDGGAMVASAGAAGGVRSAAEGGAGGAEQAGAAGMGGAASGGAPAAFLVFNTGVDNQGVALPGGSVDPHYTLIQSPDATYQGPDALVTTDIAEGYWLAQSSSSKWIAPTPNQSYPGATPCNTAGVYVWRTTIDLTGYDPATFQLSGGWAADNSGAAVLLNGVTTGFTSASYSTLAPFTLDAGFVAGVNTLDFQVNDVGCPNGLRVELSADTGVGGAGGVGGT